MIKKVLIFFLFGAIPCFGRSIHRRKFVKRTIITSNKPTTITSTVTVKTVTTKYVIN